MRRRRSTLGPKTFVVLLASVRGDAYVEITARNADMAKRTAAVRYPGWTVMSARARKG